MSGGASARASLARRLPLERGTEPAREAGTDAEFRALVRRMLELVGEDPDRPGLLDTPRRVAESMRWLTRGYDIEAEGAIAKGIFEEKHDSMVIVKGIELYSLCEHHLLPFHGQVHVAYIPDGRIVRLSKLARVVEVFARRLQVQERLTNEVADAIDRVLKPKGVGVVVQARHLCMMMRGVEKQNSVTVTSAMRGSFVDCPMTREEFLNLALRGS